MNSIDNEELLDITEILNTDLLSCIVVPEENSFVKKLDGLNGINSTTAGLVDLNSTEFSDNYNNSSVYDHTLTNDIESTFNLINNSNELDNFTDYFNTTPIDDTSYKNIYTHVNNHISLTDNAIGNGSNNYTTENNIPLSPHSISTAGIDEQLLTEIDSLIYKSTSLSDLATINSPNSYNKEKNSNPYLSPYSNSNSTDDAFVLKNKSQSSNHKVVKKPSIKRLQPNNSQSPNFKRLAKSPAKSTNSFTGMAQTAAVLATSSSSNKALLNLQRHESAKAAARAVGGNANMKKRVKQSPSTKAPLLKSSSSSTFNSNSNTFLLESPLIPPKPKLHNLNIKPSSSSIYSTTTIKTNISNISNGSTTSKNSNSSRGSTFDAYNQHHGSTDTLETIFSMDTTNSNVINDNFKVMNKSKILSSKDRCVDYDHQMQIAPLPHELQQQKNYYFPIPSSSRTNSTKSTRSRSSTASLIDAVNTPSPITGSHFTFASPNSINHYHSNNNYNNNNNNNNKNRNTSIVSSSDTETFSIHGTPLTPVTKTAFKFEQLTTNSPVISSGKFQPHSIPQNNNSKYPALSTHSFKLETPDKKLQYPIQSQFGSSPNSQNTTAIPKLSVWKTSASNTTEGKSPSLNTFASSRSKNNSTAIKSRTFSNNFIEFPKDNNTTDINRRNDDMNFDVLTTQIPTYPQSHNKSVKCNKSKNSDTVNHVSRNSMHSIYSGTSTNSTISTQSIHDEKDFNNEKKSKCMKTIAQKKQGSNDEYRQQRSSSKSHSKDAAFKNLITTFNKKEPESYKPKVYSSMVQGLVEFQVKMQKPGKNANLKQ